jgi:glycogen(starch) synthase
MYEEVRSYARKVREIASREAFDIVHAHDWMTYPAGIVAAHSASKPLVVHVYSTEFDRSGQHVNQRVYDIERAGMQRAVAILTVSNYTKNVVTKHYGVSSVKVHVAYNGVEHGDREQYENPLRREDQIVLFLGRVTMQKGPEYFLAAAKRVLEKMERVKFIMAGGGDMLHRSIELAAQPGIGHKVLFTRFLRGKDVDNAYRMADLYVMPSVSEPFGIAPLEALRQGVPVLISKQSGVAEVLAHALKVDFWDIDQMANKIIATLRYAPLRQTLRTNGQAEVCQLRWENTAATVLHIYERVLACCA